MPFGVSCGGKQNYCPIHLLDVMGALSERYVGAEGLGKWIGTRASSDGKTI